MNLSEIQSLYIQNQQIEDIFHHLQNENSSNCHIKGISGSVRSFIISSLVQKGLSLNLILLNDKEDAAYLYDDLVKCRGNDGVFFFPSSYKRSIQYGHKDTSGIVLRTEIIKKLGADNPIPIIISYPEAIIEKVITRELLKDNTLTLKKGDKIGIDFISEVLSTYHFEWVDFVYEPGQYAIRGGIVDVFSFSEEKPYRIDFFGDEVDSIRAFNIETQLSQAQLEEIMIIPDIQNPNIGEKRLSLIDFLNNNTHVWIENPSFFSARLNELFDNTTFDNDETFAGKIKKEEYLLHGEAFLKSLTSKHIIEFGQKADHNIDRVFEWNISPQPVFKKNFSLLADDLAQKETEGYKVYILSESEKQMERLKAIFHEIKAEVTFVPIQSSLHQGFVDHKLKICCYTDHQIFDRYHKYKLPENFSRTDTLTLKELNNLHPGDYVVHIDHGIGKFGGLQKIENDGKIQESIRLIYRDNDILYVSIHSLHRISKYKAKEGIPPKIYKLGSGAWQKLKQTTKSKVKDIARELITLYARRKAQKGFEFSADTYLQDELEASFIYEDTPDQLKATKDTKQDMESPVPMDRLICGDVGFGKTEIAIRAAFKAVADNKQVALLVPTTILALQHYYTFLERLKDFPCSVDYISRLKKASDQKEVLKKLEEGKIDILIGTHRILGKDLNFNDLGLLIIDEEQKFGVSAKEKLKYLKSNVDTLTLTATPIPRTLQFSLMGARDLSIIKTPPPNRYPIVTELHTFNEAIIEEAINYEVNRDGQVFIIHNRIQNINDIDNLIKKICPHVKTIVVHGQMEGSRLEALMLKFIHGDYDVLIATTIIESGLDIPNANTIIINNAQNFGLSDLHQLRGRVGRSNKKAFCYLLAPPLNTVTPEARRRLQAIEEFSDLGSGFNISLQDLDIRGAGNMLGAEQSGFIADIGFETYNRILDEAIDELKEEEFKEVFVGKSPQQSHEQGNKYVKDCAIETDMELLFPDDYITNVSERINLYRELDNIEEEESLKNFESQLSDRFGPLPEATGELMQVVRLRWLAQRLGFEKIVLKNSIMICYFISNQSSNYYKSETFSKLLQYVQLQPKHYKIKEEKNKLLLMVQHISKISNAISTLTNIADDINPIKSPRD